MHDSIVMWPIKYIILNNYNALFDIQVKVSNLIMYDPNNVAEMHFGTNESKSKDKY